MTFFNWSNEPDSPTVSEYIWIYVLITVIFTALTIGLWYYIVIVRPSRQKIGVNEENPAGLSNDSVVDNRLKNWWQGLWQTHRF